MSARSWLSAALAVVLLSGCAGSAGSKDPNSGLVDDAAFDDLDLDATKTTGVIRGVVVDDAVRPIVGANVSVTGAGTKLAQVTSEAGLFGFDDLEPGTYFLTATRDGYNGTQTAVDVVAGVDEPDLVSILLEVNPSTVPYFQDYSYEGFITCGAAIGLTSVGCTTFPAVADQLGDSYIWDIQFDVLPMWAQGELVWEQTQSAGGMFIFEMVEAGSNTHRGYRETEESPALAYWNTTELETYQDVVLDRGIGFRVFGGPHPLLKPGGPVLPPRDECPDLPSPYHPCSFGFGLTLNQDFTSFIHIFYNWVPAEGWRFTNDGEPVPPS